MLHVVDDEKLSFVLFFHVIVIEQMPFLVGLNDGLSWHERRLLDYVIDHGVDGRNYRSVGANAGGHIFRVHFLVVQELVDKLFQFNVIDVKILETVVNVRSSFLLRLLD